MIDTSASISPECYLISFSYALYRLRFVCPFKPTSVAIEYYACLSVRALMLPGVSIGRGAVVGAGAVVSRDLPAMVIVAGNPARVIGERQAEPTYTLHFQPWFDTDIS